MKLRYLSKPCQTMTLLLCVSTLASAGGPLLVGGPNFGQNGKAFTWNPSQMPIPYRVDPGPMVVTPGGQVVIDNATGLQRVQSMLNVWQGVSTAAVSFRNAGAVLPAGSYTGGDVSSVGQYNDVLGSCKAGLQSPIVFDANGGIMGALGLPPEVIGFTSQCSLDTVNGYIRSAIIVMNGKFEDGVDSGTNFELTANEFDEAITHEIGHFLGLDHSQINLDLLTQQVFPCDLDRLAGLPLMFPEELCQARKDAGLPVLSPDDIAWISTLYPNAQTANTYGVIRGTIYFPDGVSAFQGANVIVRAVDDPNTVADESRRIAVSCISGYRFTGNPGQDITGDNTGGSPTGSRDPALIGYFEIPVPAGQYTVEVETVFSGFDADSGIGPMLSPVQLPFLGEYWHQNESAFDYTEQRDIITVHAGDNISGIDIIVNGSLLRFDGFEDSASLLPTRRNDAVAGGAQ